MKLVKRVGTNWWYELDWNEVNLLTLLLKQFPFNELDPVKLSKTDEEPKAKEREKLLNESLVEHRKELEEAAANLLNPEKFKAQGNGMVMKLNAEEREMLLQILNDTRVGCWHTLGKPDSLEPQSPNLTVREQSHYGLMTLAGYFEHSLLAPGKTNS